jgi:hypothetical protein
MHPVLQYILESKKNEIKTTNNPNLSFEIIKNNLDIEWDWREISESNIITLEIINENPDLPWEWSSITVNPNKR